ncbi:hypothetical protein [Janthinobacterium sp. PSPC3-1]|uniref:hypothetical protein n=1 Tax=Janthinobacterium sp. PSPC3-1 TaxID=2804653 RepID=UPI003CF314A3
MADNERIEVLKRYVEGWEEMRDNAVARRDSALILKSVGVEARDNDGVDVLQKRADEADNEAAICHKNVLRMQALLGRAQAGEDV